MKGSMTINKTRPPNSVYTFIFHLAIMSGSLFRASFSELRTSNLLKFAKKMVGHTHQNRKSLADAFPDLNIGRPSTPK